MRSQPHSLTCSKQHEPSTSAALPRPSLQALAKIAVRSGEPYRLQCYSVLAAAGGAGGGGSDALGLRSATRPALALLDKLYAAQASPSCRVLPCLPGGVAAGDRGGSGGVGSHACVGQGEHSEQSTCRTD